MEHHDTKAWGTSSGISGFEVIAILLEEQRGPTLDLAAQSQGGAILQSESSWASELRLRFRVQDTRHRIIKAVLDDKSSSIDGVILRSSTPIPGARDTLRYLHQHGVPYILLTNGGGKHESDRIKQLSHLLQAPLDPGIIVQSHTPFKSMAQGKLKDAPILVVGGDGDNCRQVALR